MSIVDLRSDTVTRPTAAMRQAMNGAEVGDDVYGEDPSVNRLEARSAELTGHDAGLLVASGTQGNLLGLLAHCERGDEYIAGQEAHCYRTEGGGAAVLGSIQPQPIHFEPDGSLDLDRVAAAIKPDDIHCARTRVLCLENTWSGRVVPLDYIEQARRLAHARGLAMHLDGARVFNAAVALGVPAARITRLFDSVSFCLSKGLGAPVGSVLCGSEAFIGRARRWRKVVGGGMRQAGFLAAAGLHALEHHVERLGEDHANARTLAESLDGMKGLSVDRAHVQTNMVYVKVEADADALVDFMAERDIRLSRRNPLRLVTHLDVDRSAIERTIAAFEEFTRTPRAVTSAAGG